MLSELCLLINTTTYPERSDRIGATRLGITRNAVFRPWTWTFTVSEYWYYVLFRFDLYFRRNPFGGEYTVFAGLEDCIKLIANFRFTEDEISFIQASLPSSCEVRSIGLPHMSICIKLHPSIQICLNGLLLNCVLYLKVTSFLCQSLNFSIFPEL